MPSNLANLYAYMKRMCEGLDVMYSAPVSYLKTLTGQEDKVIFVFKANKANIKLHEFLSPKKITKQETNLDLTGSPLKDTCEIDTLDISLDMKLSSISPWSFEEESFTALPLEKARAILCDPNFQNEAEGSSGSVWILCNATDVSKTVLMQMHFEKNFNTRGIIKYNGVIPTYQVNSADLMKRHSDTMRSSTKADSVISSYFHINPNMSIKLSWSSSSPTPSLNNFKSSEVSLYQTFAFKEFLNPSTEEFMNQLNILAIIKDAIVEFKQSDDDTREAIYTCGRGITLDELKDKVLYVMTELSGFYDVDSETNSPDIEAVVQRAKMRQSLDLTDKLWDILKCCSSYKDLKIAFNYVFQCSAKCNLVNMPTNDNRLAEIIREVSQRRLAIPCLTGSEPLELLLEIGLEKLYKDYVYIFTNSEICSTDDLKFNQKENLANNEPEVALNFRKSLHTAMRPDVNKGPQRKTLLHSSSTANAQDTDSEIIGFQNSKFEKKEIEYKLAKLLQIHLILEHLLMIQNNLNLENVYSEVFQLLMQKTPKSFNSTFSLGTDKIEIPLPIDSVVQHLENKDPHARKITVTSRNKFLEVQNTFFYSMDNIFPPNIFEGIQTEEKEMVKENVYHSWHYTKIKTSRC